MPKKKHAKGFYKANTFADRPMDENFVNDVLRAIFETAIERNGRVNLGQGVVLGSFSFDTLCKLHAAPNEKNWKKVKNVLYKFKLRDFIRKLEMPTHLAQRPSPPSQLPSSSPPPDDDEDMPFEQHPNGRHQSKLRHISAISLCCAKL